MCMCDPITPHTQLIFLCGMDHLQPNRTTLVCHVLRRVGLWHVRCVAFCCSISLSFSISHTHTHTQRVQEATDFIREENRTKYERLGVVIGDPMDRGLRCVSNTYIQ